MEFITVDYIEQVKHRIMPFVIFVGIPCFFWWLFQLKVLVKGIFGMFFVVVDDEPVKPLKKPLDDYDGDYLG